jgi:hypothetical protein
MADPGEGQIWQVKVKVRSGRSRRGRGSPQINLPPLSKRCIIYILYITLYVKSAFTPKPNNQSINRPRSLSIRLSLSISLSIYLTLSSPPTLPSLFTLQSLPPLPYNSFCSPAISLLSLLLRSFT